MSQETAGTERKRALKRPIEEIRAELMKDPDTARIAKAVSMELGAYVEKVLDYLQHPDKKPVFEVADEDDMRAAGFKPMSEQDVHDVFAGVVNGDLDPANKFQKSGFEASSKPAASVASPSNGGAVPSGPQDEAKRQELMEQIKKGGVPRG